MLQILQTKLIIKKNISFTLLHKFVNILHFISRTSIFDIFELVRSGVLSRLQQTTLSRIEDNTAKLNFEALVMYFPGRSLIKQTMIFLMDYVSLTLNVKKVIYIDI